MKRIISFTITVLMLSLGAASAGPGDEGKNIYRFGFMASLSDYQVKEYTLNSLVHKGLGFLAGFTCSSTGHTSVKKLEIQSGLNMLKSIYETENGSYLFSSSARYIHNMKLYCLPDAIDLYIGGMAGLDAQVGYYENWNESHYYWITAYYIGLNGLLGYDISSRSRIAIELGLPLLALVSCPPEGLHFIEAEPALSAVLGKIHEDPGLATWPAHVALDLKLGYEW